MIRIAIAAAFTVACLTAGPALAQSAPVPTAGGASPSSRMTQVPSGTAGPCGPGQQSPSAATDDLSSKLADCNGVIAPPATGDEMFGLAAADPNPSSTPVIKPQTGDAVPK